MALKQIKQANKEAEVQQFEGVGKFTFRAVNPTAKEIEELFGYAPEKEPTYITKDANGKVTDIRLAFYGTIENDDGSVVANHNFSIFLKRQAKENDPSQRDIKGHKFMFIDRFGNTVWETKEHEKVLGRKFDYDNCHIAFEGEDVLVNLMSAMNPDIRKDIWIYDENDKSYTLKTGDLTDAENYLEETDVKEIWKGNLKALLEVLRSACTVGTQIKLAVGQKEGSSYPVTYVRSFVSGKVTIKNALKQYKSKIEKNCSSKESYPMVEFKMEFSNLDSSVETNAGSEDDLPSASPSTATATMNDDDDMPF